MSETITTLALLDTLSAPQEIVAYMTDNNLLNMPISAMLSRTQELGLHELSAWWGDQRTTEAYVRATNEHVTVGEHWQLYNPFSGAFEQFTNLNTAKARLAEIAMQVINTYSPRLTTALVASNGDSIWIPTQEHTKLTVSIS